MSSYRQLKEIISVDIEKKETRTATCVQSNILSELGINRMKNETQHINHFTVYPQSYFFTKDEGWTYHSFSGSW